MSKLRPYQADSVEAVHNYICTSDGNPCVVIPTAGGKSHCIAGLVKKWFIGAPWFRTCILAHRRELINQNYEKLKAAAEDMPIGIFAAGLGKRDYDAQVLFASIDSIYKKAGEFQPFDVLIVDEAHHIAPKGETKYRKFIADCKKFNPKLRVVGYTATPYRMSSGPICHRDHILTEICYEAKIPDLIEQDYLCPPRSKVGETQPDLTSVKSNSRGDYILNSLSSVTNKKGLVDSAVEEALRIIKQENRKHCLWFCVDVAHGQLVTDALRAKGIFAPLVTGKTAPDDRQRILKDFKSGYLSAVCSIQVLTEGFDSPNIDCIVLLRPTLSPGLYYQMIGRGLRLHPNKTDCLCLDMAGLIDEHGPIDLLGEGQRVVMATCAKCRESFSRAIRKCPECGWEIPKQEIERLENVERERRMHSDKVSKKSILSTEPETHKVDAVYVRRHCKEGSPDSLCVQYRCSLSLYREWVCLDHPSPAGELAQRWWQKRFGKQKERATVKEALESLFTTQGLLEWTKSITVKKDGKYWKVVGYNEQEA